METIEKVIPPGIFMLSLISTTANPYDYLGAGNRSDTNSVSNYIYLDACQPLKDYICGKTKISTEVVNFLYGTVREKYNITFWRKLEQKYDDYIKKVGEEQRYHFDYAVQSDFDNIKYSIKNKQK